MSPIDGTPTEDARSPEAFCRSDGVVWRLAPDRVLVRRLGDLSANGCADLIGLAAAVWVGLDEPASIAELHSRLADAGFDVETARADPDGITMKDALAALVERGWIEPVDVA